MADSKQPPDTPKTGDYADAGEKGICAAGKSCLMQQHLLAALTTTDQTIRRLHLLLSNAGGQDRVLATVSYVTSILHHLTASAPWIVMQTRLGLLARLRGRTPALKTTSAPFPSRFLALASLASQTRYNLRLFGLLPLWIWGSNTLKSPPADPIIHALTVLQVISNVIYQLLENVAYLSEKGVISKRFVDKYGGAKKWYLWSTRGWLGHIFLQFFVLWRQSVLRKRRLAALRRAAGSVKAQTDPDQNEELRLEIRAWRKSLVNNACWAPLCLHWSLENGIGIPANLTGLISLSAVAWAVRDLWDATAIA